MTNTARSDVARLLPAVYAIFAIAATGRSAVQLATRGGHAPVPYGLSAVAGVVYIGGFVALWRAPASESAQRLANALCLFELFGVVAVGLFSILFSTDLPDDTVWSRFGSGYGYIPLALPLAALWWLRAADRRAEACQHSTPIGPV